MTDRSTFPADVYRPLRNEDTFELLRELRMRRVLKTVHSTELIGFDKLATMSKEASFDMIRAYTDHRAKELGLFLLSEGAAMQFYHRDDEKRAFDLSVRAEVVYSHAAMDRPA